MDYDRLWAVADRAKSNERLSADDIKFIRHTVPSALETFPRVKPPKSIRHPQGFTLAGAPVRTFLKSNLLLAANRALGPRFGGSEFYEDVEKELAFGIMRSYFHHGYPKGTHCCQQCTLAVYPVLERRAIRYFDCAEQLQNVKRIIRDGEWRFASPPNPRLLHWATEDHL